MTINTSGLGGGGLPRLAPDLTYPADKTGAASYQQVVGIDASAGLTTALSLTGKFAVSYLNFGGVLSENMTIKLTIDGGVIWNDIFAAASANQLFFGGVSGGIAESMECNNSLLLEVQMATDTDITLSYLARPLL